MPRAGSVVGLFFIIVDGANKKRLYSGLGHNDHTRTPFRRCVYTPDHLKTVRPLSRLTTLIKGIDTRRGADNANGTASSRN